VPVSGDRFNLRHIRGALPAILVVLRVPCGNMKGDTCHEDAMIQGLHTAVAGLTAAAKRTDIAAGNIANARTTGALDPYTGFTPQQAVQTSAVTGAPVVRTPMPTGWSARRTSIWRPVSSN
jgi:hypothetical protein